MMEIEPPTLAQADAILAEAGIGVEAPELALA